MSDYPNKTQTIITKREVAENNNWEVVLPRVDELLIDLDSAEAVSEFDKRYKLVSNIFKLEEISRTDSKSGGGRKHVVVRVLETPLTDTLRVLFQAILGSDFRRELFSLTNILAGNICPTIFFEKKKEDKTKITTKATEIDLWEDVPF